MTTLLSVVVPLVFALAPVPPTPQAPPSALQQPADRPPPPAATEHQPAGSGNGYRVGPGDVLHIAVYGHADLDQTVAVQPDGSLVLPLIGSVAAGGATTGELERQISTRLAKGLIRDAYVSVTVEQYRSKLVFVVGEVSRPGAYPLAGETRIVEILARAGPLTKDASTDILVVRPTEQVERPVPPAQVKVRAGQRAGGQGLPVGQVLRVDVQAIQAGRLDENLVLEPNDTVFVPLAEQIFVTGEVRSPGAVTFRRGITARQAVALAGGFTDGASTGSVHVSRDVIGTSRTLKLRLDEQLQAGDTVIVKKAWF
jgi:polysaccharide export outer membrane protein